MILPSKHLPVERALLTVGAGLLIHLHRPMTVSALWEQVTRGSERRVARQAIRYDRFVLALDLLFLIGAVDIRDGLLIRGAP